MPDGEIAATGRVRTLRPKLRVYLSGNISKGSADPVDTSWTTEDERRIREGVTSCEVETLNPAHAPVSRGDPVANFGCDIYMVQSSDAVLVDATGKRGLGVGAEMMFARMRQIPVISVCPAESAYRQHFVQGFVDQDIHDWTHPFVHQLSSFIADDLKQAIHHLSELGAAPSRLDPFDPESAIAHYLNELQGAFAEDRPRLAG